MGMHLAPQRDLNPTNLPPPPSCLFPLPSSSCSQYLDSFNSLCLQPYHTSTPLCPCHACHSSATSSARVVTKWCRTRDVCPSGGAGAAVWPSWRHLWSLRVFFMEPAGVLPEPQALILLVGENFLSCSVSGPCPEGTERGASQKVDFCERFHISCTMLRTDSFDVFRNMAPSWELFFVNRSDKAKSDFISVGCWGCFSIASLWGRDSLCTEAHSAHYRSPSLHEHSFLVC